MRKKETDSASESAKATASETFYDYVEWKRGKVERALKRSDEHPDVFVTEKEIWNTHGLGS